MRKLPRYDIQLVTRYFEGQINEMAIAARKKMVGKKLENTPNLKRIKNRVMQWTWM